MYGLKVWTRSVGGLHKEDREGKRKSNFDVSSPARQQGNPARRLAAVSHQGVRAQRDNLLMDSHFIAPSGSTCLLAHQTRAPRLWGKITPDVRIGGCSCFGRKHSGVLVFLRTAPAQEVSGQSEPSHQTGEESSEGRGFCEVQIMSHDRKLTAAPMSHRGADGTHQ